MRDWLSIIIALLVVLALALGAIQLLTLGRVVEFWDFFASWIVATGTLLLAFSTEAMAEATRRSVEEIQKERRVRVEACFRAALLELNENLHYLRRWDPRFGSQPESGWLSRGLRLERFREALSAEWIPAGLWDYMIAAAVRVERLWDNLKENLKIRGNIEEVQSLHVLHLLLDLWLVHLARCLVAEMRRQGMRPPEDLTRVFTPIPWAWEDKDPQEAVLEAVSPPLVHSLPPMPEDPAYQDARLEMLIREAQESYRKQMSRLMSRLRGLSE
jgi:hypothetical protein